MTLRDEHTNCSLLEEGQRVTMSRTGSKRSDNLKQKVWPSIENSTVLCPKRFRFDGRSQSDAILVCVLSLRISSINQQLSAKEGKSHEAIKLLHNDGIVDG